MYEIGDKVIYQGADKKAYKKHGVVKSIEDKDGKPQLTVELDGGETFTAPIDDWSREFSNACKNAKFIKGDFVKIKGWPGTFRIDIINPDGTYAVKKYPSGQPTIGRYKENELELEEANACVSTNSVVRNAMAVAAKNARLVPFDRYAVKPGDSVWYKGREFEYKGMRGLRAELEDVFDGETEIVGIFDRDLKMAANAVVTNALAKKQFGNVTAYLYKGLAGISVNSISHQAEGDAPKDCVASAKAMLADYEKAVAGIKNAIAWMSAL